MTKEDIQRVLARSLEYYKCEVFGTDKESEKPSRERIDWIYDKIKGSSEKPIIQDGLEKEYEDYVVKDLCFSKLVNRNAGLVIARYFAKWGAEHLADARKTSPIDLEEAAEEYMQGEIDSGHDCLEIETNEPLYYPEAMKHAFIAGAKWQNEQMIKESIPCKVFWHDGPLLDYTQEQQDNALERIGADVGDKVKIIIIKEDEK